MWKIDAKTKRKSVNKDCGVIYKHFISYITSCVSEKNILQSSPVNGLSNAKIIFQSEPGTSDISAFKLTNFSTL